MKQYDTDFKTLPCPHVDKKSLTKIRNSSSSEFKDLVHLVGLDLKNDFRYSDLRGVDFGDVDLDGADFTGSDLTRASLKRARITQSTIFTDAILDSVIWSESEGFDTDTTTFGDRVAGARQHANLSRSELAKILGVRTKTLENWEEDVSDPRATMLSKMASWLNVSILWLLSGEGEGLPGERDPTSVTSVTIKQATDELKDLQEQLILTGKRMDRLIDKMQSYNNPKEDKSKGLIEQKNDN